MKNYSLFFTGFIFLISTERLENLSFCILSIELSIWTRLSSLYSVLFNTLSFFTLSLLEYYLSDIFIVLNRVFLMLEVAFLQALDFCVLYLLDVLSS